jgi:Uma2 family endonuclease
VSGLKTRPWTRREYGDLIRLGLLQEGEKVELLAGRMIVAEPQSSQHALAVRLAQRALERAFGEGWDVRCQLPIALDHASEPEPDVSVVPGSPRDYLEDHPTRPALVLEVADWSLRLDRGLKARRYARAGIADYWLVNLPARVLEVRRAPGLDHGRWSYRSLDVLGPEAWVSPLAAAGRDVRVSDLLP